VHALLQSPQLAGSLFVSTHEAPQAVLVPQSVLQAPPWQNMFAPHTLPQAPQFFESERRSWHAPEQLLYPVLQLTVHCLAVHSATPFAGSAQAWPHAPQLLASVSSF